jgi:hypothetical protein
VKLRGLLTVYPPPGKKAKMRRLAVALVLPAWGHFAIFGGKRQVGKMPFFCFLRDTLRVRLAVGGEFPPYKHYPPCKKRTKTAQVTGYNTLFGGIWLYSRIEKRKNEK